MLGYADILNLENVVNKRYSGQVSSKVASDSEQGFGCVSSILDEVNTNTNKMLLLIFDKFCESRAVDFPLN